MKPKVRAVWFCAVLDVEPERLAVENAGIFGKQTKQDADQETLQFVTAVAAGFQRVVQVVHDSHGPQVNRILVLETMPLIAGDQGELVDVPMELSKLEFLGINPVAGKANGILADFIPGNGHRLPLSLRAAVESLAFHGT